MNKHLGFKTGFLILTFLLGISVVSAQPASSDFITITPDNADQLELGYVLPGFCRTPPSNQDLIVVSKIGVYNLFTGQLRFKITGKDGVFSPHGNYFISSTDGVLSTDIGKRVLPYDGFFSPDEKYLAVQSDGLYELATSKRLFPINAVSWFTPDSQLIAVYNDAIYKIKTGERLTELPMATLTFSPNSKYFALWGIGIYDTTGKQLIASKGIIPEFSPNSQYVSISNDAVYNVESGQKLITLADDAETEFSSDSKLVAITDDGLYDLATLKRRFRLGTSQYYPPRFLKNSQWLDLSNDGIYNLATNQKHFPVSSYILSATQDSSLIIIDQKGIFETSTGELKFRIKDAQFIAKDKLVSSNMPTLDAPDSVFCGVYGIKGDKWPYRSGLVDTSHTQIYGAPDGDKRLDAQGRPLTTARQQAVFAQTSDKKWLKIGDNNWVKASDVQPVSLPEGIPIENPF